MIKNITIHYNTGPYSFNYLGINYINVNWTPVPPIYVYGIR